MRADVKLSENGSVQSVTDLRKCTELIRDRVLARLNTAIAGKLVESVNVLRETYTSTLTRWSYSLLASSFRDHLPLALHQFINEYVRI